MSFEGNNFRVDSTRPETASESPDSLADLQSKIEKLKEQAHAAQLNIYELPEYDALDAVVHKVGVLKARQEKLTWERDPKIKERFSDVNNQIAKLLAEGNSYIDALSQMATARSESFKKSVGDKFAAVRDQMTVYDRDYEEEKRKADLTPPAVAPEKAVPVVLPEPVAVVVPAVEISSTPEARLEAIQQNYNRAKEAWLIARQAWESAKKMKNIPAGRVHDLEVQFDLAELAYIRAKREYEKEIGVAPEVEAEPVKSKKGTRFNSLKAFLIGATIVTPTEQRAEEAVTQFPVVTEIGPSEPLFNTFGELSSNQNTFGARRTQSFVPVTTAPVESQPEPIEIVQTAPVYEEPIGTPADGSEMRDPAVFDSNPIADIQTESPVASFNVNPITEYAPVFSGQSEVVAQVAPQVLENPVANLDSAPVRVIVEVDGGGVETQYMPRALEVCKQYPRIPDRVADRLIHEIIAEYTQNPEMLRLRDVDRVSADDNRVDLTDVLSFLDERCRGVDAALQSGQEVIPETGSDMTKELNKYFASELATLENESDRASVVNSVIEELKHNPEFLGRLADGLTDVHHISDLQLLRLGLLRDMVESLVSEKQSQSVTETVEVEEFESDTLPQETLEDEQVTHSEIVDVEDELNDTVVSEVKTESIISAATPQIVSAKITEVEQLVDDTERVLRETAPDATPDVSNEQSVDSEPLNETSTSRQEVTEKVVTPEKRYQQLLESIGVKEPGLIARITSSAEFTRYSDFEKLSKFTVGDLRDIALRTKPGPELREELRSYGISDVELFDSVIQLLLKNKGNLSNVMSVEKALQNIAVNNS